MSDSAKDMPSLAERLWRDKDVAEYLQMSVSWVNKKTAAGKIPCIRLAGHSIRYDPEKVKTWAAAQAGGKVVTFKRG